MGGGSAPVRRDYGGRSAEQRRAERRERMFTAGLELFGTEGYRQTSIERLCAAANVSTRNFYEEFTGRDRLLIALHERITVQAVLALAQALDDEQDASLADRMARIVRAYLHTTLTDPRWARICYVEVVGAGPAVERQRQEWRERVAAFLVAEAERAVGRGEAPARDYRLAAVAFIGAVNELAGHWATRGRDIPLEEVCAELTRLAVAVLTAV
jgi:AcrR family transcriptional regulator